MGEPLLCPKCKKGDMKWVDPNLEDLLEEGIMECRKCKSQYKGIPGWQEAMYPDWDWEFNEKKKPMNKNVKDILETVAAGVWHSKGGTVDELFHLTQCVFCYVAPHSEHAPDCPTTLAKHELEKNT